MHMHDTPTNAARLIYEIGDHCMHIPGVLSRNSMLSSLKSTIEWTSWLTV